MSNPVEIVLIILIVFTSTCFGYCVGKDNGFREGLNFYAKIFSKLHLIVSEKKEENENG